MQTTTEAINLFVEILCELHYIEPTIVKKYILKPGMQTAAGFKIVEANNAD